MYPTCAAPKLPPSTNAGTSGVYENLPSPMPISKAAEPPTEILIQVGIGN